MKHKALLLLKAAAVGAVLLPAQSYALLYDQNVTNNAIFGSGNANGSFTVDRANGIELGLRGKLRHNASGVAENTFNSNGDGTYSFAAGVAPTQSSPTAVWSFEWSINSNYDGTSGWNLNGLTYALRIDSNPTQATTFSSFDPINDAGPLGGGWDHSIGTNATAQGAGTEAISGVTYAALIADNNLAQNSWKAHWFLGAGFDPTVDGTYDFELSAYIGSREAAKTRIQVIVGAGGAAVPDGGATLALVGLGLAGLIGLRRRFAS